jgi:hypothetical protein
MQPTHAVSTTTHSNRGIAMQPTKTLSTVSSVLPVTDERPSGIRFVTKTRPAVAPRTELLASQVHSVALAEIAWFFTRDTSDETSERAAARIYWWLRTLDPSEQQTLALRYEAMPCPKSLERHWGNGGYALALSLACASLWRPQGTPRHSLEREASDQLEAAVEKHGDRVLEHIKRRAEWDFTDALSAYAHARGRVPSVIPVSQ